MDDISNMSETHDAGRSLDLLHALDALLELVSVTKAAERRRLSQPAMSRILGRLRVQFGDPLLVRVGKGWELTPRGLALRAPLGDVLRGADALYHLPSFHPDSSTRTFRMAIPDVIGAALLPDLHGAISRAAPGCTLVVIPWPGDGVDLQDLDIAIGSESRLFPTFRMEPLFDDVDELAYRLRDGPPTEAEQLSRDHVAVIPAGFRRDLADDWLATHGLSREIAIVVPHYLQALHLVARTGLMAILPSRLIATLGQTVGVGGARLAVPQDPDRQWLLYPARLQSDPAGIWLRKMVRAAVNAV
ncbi:DNA-binding transcriptional LysR family regulator [Sphingomonas sp. UYAg733]